MNPSTNSEQLPLYQIEMVGKINEQWSDWLGKVAITHDQASSRYVTTLTGPAVDQAALRGILNKLWDLNLTLLSVKRRENSLMEEESSSCRARLHLAHLRQVVNLSYNFKRG